jgi:Fe-S-cluster containining protein
MEDRESLPTCPGHCCAVLRLRDSLETLRAEDDPESQQIADMVIPLTHRQAVARSRKFGSTCVIKATPAGPNSGWYACRNWDEETRLCTIYEDRPSMCRDYPYDRECRHGCGYRSPPEVVREWAEWRQTQAAAPGSDESSG